MGFSSLLIAVIRRPGGRSNSTKESGGERKIKANCSSLVDNHDTVPICKLYNSIRWYLSKDTGSIYTMGTNCYEPTFMRPSDFQEGKLGRTNASLVGKATTTCHVIWTAMD